MNTGAQTVEIAVIGPSNLDVLASGNAQWGAVRSNPAVIRMTPGGGARNIAENLARLGLRVTLLTVTGDDIFGEFVTRRTAQAGVTIAQIVESGVRTPVYLAINQEDGEVVLDIFDGEDCLQGLSAVLGQKYIEQLQDARFLVASTDIRSDLFSLLADVADDTGATLVVAVSAPSVAARSSDWMTRANVLLMSSDEASVVAGSPIRNLDEATNAASQIALQGCGTVVVTLGARGASYATKNGLTGHKPAINPSSEVVSTTGAGDAFCAGFVYGLAHERDVDECVSLGLAAATLTIVCSESVNPAINSSRVDEAAGTQGVTPNT